MTNESELFIEYSCPDGCQDTWFYQDGTVEARELLEKNGERFETKYYDFTPHPFLSPEGAPDGKVRCRKCQQPAIQRKYKETVVREEIL